MQVNTRLIIDGDIFLYKASFAAEREIPWDDSEEFWLLYAELGKAKRGFEEAIHKMSYHLGVEDYLICFSGTRVFRHGIDDEYKANRAYKRKPVVIKPLREYIIKNHPTHIEDNLEADDLLGLLATPTDIMVSSDKDLLTVPGMHYDPSFTNWKRGIVQISPLEAIHHHYTQTLTGDTADNFKGCPKVGPVTARKILKACPPMELWDNVVAAFEKQGLTEEDALVQARLSYILRGDDYDFKTKQVNSWTPENYREYDRTPLSTQ